MINRVKSFLRKFKPKQYKQHCPICDQACTFLPLQSFFYEMLQKHGFKYSLDKFETLALDYYTCSLCGSSDRDRLCAVYLLERKMIKKPIKMLHIAPSDSLQRFIDNTKTFESRTCDLYMPNVDDKVDITDMKIYSDGQFDSFICSHVLEHVSDDKLAAKELYRILNKNGFGIVLVPICLAIKNTHEDFSKTSDEERWKHFGQNDHVRLYSKQGFIQLLEGVGFKVYPKSIVDFKDYSFRNHGIDSKSVLYVVKKS